MRDTLTVDVSGFRAEYVADVLALVQRYRSQSTANTAADDESWRTAKSTGWTKQHLELLRAHLKSRGKTVQLAAVNRAVENGGFVSREEIYSLGGYSPTRKLNNWSVPINNFSEVLVERYGLPAEADWPIETEYGEGTGYRPAIGFNVAPELVRLARTE